MITVDATNLVSGRLASFVAKKLLEGETVEVINSEKAVVTGKKELVLNIFREKIERGEPHHGPIYPRTSERLLRRIIRRMLPFKHPRGKAAFKLLKCFRGTEGAQSATGITLDHCNVSKMKNLSFITLEQLASELKGKVK